MPLFAKGFSPVFIETYILRDLEREGRVVGKRGAFII
jgi:hypothetical protein